jgi:DNA repair photolyase
MQERQLIQLQGRGALSNPANRFERLAYELMEEEENIVKTTRTEYFRDASRSIIATNDSPDIPFETSINPYRGCEHGCIYCYARPTHEFLGFSAGIDFESRIMVKEDAPELLQHHLGTSSYRPQVIAISGVTDAYQPIERKLQLTRRCLEILLSFRNPVIIITKSQLVTRDIDLLAELSQVQAAAVFLSITTLDEKLSRVMEPRAAIPAKRLEAIRQLSAAGIPVGVLIAPVIPGLTDHEIFQILTTSYAEGARFAGFQIVRLPLALQDLFSEWLALHFPHRQEKILTRLKEMRGGRLNDPRFGHRMNADGVFANQIKQMFSLAYRKLGFAEMPELSCAAFRRVQPSLFD